MTAPAPGLDDPGLKTPGLDDPGPRDPAPRAPAAASPPGLRERKKRRTRDALIREALELFTTQGYERTTVDEIADAVEVSQRTFFRYFASKEEVAFAVQRMVEERFVHALAQRPPQEGPFDAMRNAVLCAWDTIGEAIAEVVPVELHLRTFRMIESTPALLAAHLRRSAEMEETISRIVADREGLDVDEDPRPRIAVATFSAAMRVTAQMWGRGTDQSLAAIRELTERYLDHLNPALALRWRDGSTT